jgi:hypothetical protein
MKFYLYNFFQVIIFDFIFIISTVYACEEDWTMMDQTQSSFSHDETSHYETLDAEYLEEDTLDEGI